ncbi:MAG: glycosyltransferase [Candidatus Micrarchaeaceae archaeon]
MDYGNITVVLPTLNEEYTIGTLLRYLTSTYKGIKVIVADDGSKDKTKSVVTKFSGKNVKFLDRHAARLPRGLTFSVIDGILQARTNYVIVMDADMQHPPEKIKALAKCLESGYDLAVAVRRKVEGWQFYRKLISKALIYVGYLILFVKGKSRCGDIFSGYFGIRRSLFLQIYNENKTRFVGEGYKILFDFLKCADSGSIKICNVPYSFGLRKSGESKAGLKQGLAVIKSFFS